VPNDETDPFDWLFSAPVTKARKLARRMKFQSLDISIETDKGHYRHWYDPHNKKEGKTMMTHPYGYIRRTMGADDEQVDVYVGPNEDAKSVYVIHQQKAPDFKKYDEDKVMIGFNSAKEAKAAYLRNFDDEGFFGSMDEMSMEDFKNSFVKKGFSVPPQDLNVTDPTLGGKHAEEGGMDLDNLASVQMLLQQVPAMPDQGLAMLVREIWGDNYQYNEISLNQIRAEVMGFLFDQQDFLMKTPELAATQM